MSREGTALRLAPVLVEKPWGGRRLAALGRALPPDGLFGEAWDVADLTAERTSVRSPVSPVVGGRHDGRTLAELVASDREWLLGDVAPTDDGRFPLLVKTLDATQHLSVQAHPTPASVGPGEHLKTETWVVLEAAPDAAVLVGLRDGTSQAAFRAAVGTPDLVPLLRPVPVAVGDVLHLPSGTIHALGAGVVVAEVQTPSDTTYRLYDWSVELARAPRELHLERGARAVVDAWERNLAAPVRVAPRDTPGAVPLVDEEAYELVRVGLAPDTTWHGADRRAPTVVVVLAGTPLCCGELLGRGAVRLVPAGEDAVLAGPGTLLLATPR